MGEQDNAAPFDGPALAGNSPETEPAAQPAGASLNPWPRLGWLDWAAVLSAVVPTAVLSFPQLPRGICFHDSGGFQVAAASLGITHPPGYAGYVTLAHLFTWIPGIDPAFTVMLLCFAAGLWAVALCVLFQIRLGLHPLVAAAVGLLLPASAQIWTNLLKVEVYVPTLALVATAFYLVLKYERRRRWAELALAALIFGFAVANRPPTVLTLPFLLAAWWIIERRHNRPCIRSAGRLAVATVLAAAPAAYSFAYYWLRDTPWTRYNYIEVFNAETHDLPQTADGPQAKLRRVIWHASAEQFRGMMGNDWKGVRQKLRWARSTLKDNVFVESLASGLMFSFPFQHWRIVYVVLLVPIGAGAVILARRSVPALLLLTGMIVASLTFVCYYRISGEAADLRGMIFALCVLLGMGLATIFPRQASRPRHVLAGCILAVMLAGTFVNASDRHGPAAAHGGDAREFLADFDLASLPKNAVIFSNWIFATPLWYDRLYFSQREDIEIINALGQNWWVRFDPTRADRTFAATPLPPDWPGYRWVPYVGRGSRDQGIERSRAEGKSAGRTAQEPPVIFKLEPAEDAD